MRGSKPIRTKIQPPADRLIAVHAGAWLVLLGCYEAGRHDGQVEVGKSA